MHLPGIKQELVAGAQLSGIQVFSLNKKRRNPGSWTTKYLHPQKVEVV